MPYAKQIITVFQTTYYYYKNRNIRAKQLNKGLKYGGGH